MKRSKSADEAKQSCQSRSKRNGAVSPYPSPVCESGVPGAEAQDAAVVAAHELAGLAVAQHVLRQLGRRAQRREARRAQQRRRRAAPVRRRRVRRQRAAVRAAQPARRTARRAARRVPPQLRLRLDPHPDPTIQCGHQIDIRKRFCNKLR